MLTRSLAWMFPFTLPRTTTDFADKLRLDPAGGTHRQDVLRQLDRPVDLAVDNEVLAPLDVALDDDPLPYRGDALGSVRQTGTLSTRRRQTPDRCIVSKLCLDHLKQPSIHLAIAGDRSCSAGIRFHVAHHLPRPIRRTTLVTITPSPHKMVPVRARTV